MHYGNITATYRAASYAAFSVNESLTNKCILMVPQLRFHIPKIKSHLRGHHFGCNRPTENSFNRRIPTLHPGVGASLSMVYSCLKELF